MPRDVSLSDSKCWNGGHEWVKTDCARTLLMIYPQLKRFYPLHDLWEKFTLKNIYCGNECLNNFIIIGKFTILYIVIYYIVYIFKRVSLYDNF